MGVAFKIMGGDGMEVVGCNEGLGGGRMAEMGKISKYPPCDSLRE